jgi:hypothetical protein
MAPPRLASFNEPTVGDRLSIAFVNSPCSLESCIKSAGLLVLCGCLLAAAQSARRSERLFSDLARSGRNAPGWASADPPMDLDGCSIARSASSRPGLVRSIDTGLRCPAGIIGCYERIVSCA